MKFIDGETQTVVEKHLKIQQIRVFGRYLIVTDIRVKLDRSQ
jgi:hypothetical protein